MQVPDISQLERKAGLTAANSLRSAYRSEIDATFKSRSGAMAKSNVSARFKDGRLDRLVISSPHYSFKHHYGSNKKGTQQSYTRSPGYVKAFTRRMASGDIMISAHMRGGGRVKAHTKGINYKSTNHISDALKSTNALDVLATELGQNRAVLITSTLDF